MVLEQRGVEIQRSRISYFYNYLLLAMVLIFFVLVWTEYELTFTFLPKTPSEFSKSLTVLGFILLIAFLIEEPTIYRMFCKYIITNNEVIKVDGILRKRRTIIPYQSVANVGVYKSILGRILSFGDIKIQGFRDKIDMVGVRNPEVFYRIINNKIAVMSGTAPKVVGTEEKATGEKVLSTDWRKERRALEKETKPLKTITPRVSGRREKSDIFGFLKSFKPIEGEEEEEAEEAGEYEKSAEGEEGGEPEKPQRKKRKRNKRKRKPKGTKR